MKLRGVFNRQKNSIEQFSITVLKTFLQSNYILNYYKKLLNSYTFYIIIFISKRELSTHDSAVKCPTLKIERRLIRIPILKGGVVMNSKDLLFLTLLIIALYIIKTTA